MLGLNNSMNRCASVRDTAIQPTGRHGNMCCGLLYALQFHAMRLYHCIDQVERFALLCSMSDGLPTIALADLFLGVLILASP